MAHFNNRNGNRQQSARGQQGDGAPRLPVAFDKGELIELTFSTVPARDGGTYVASILSDNTHVEPGSYGEYRFVPVLDEKSYLCSVMGGKGKCSALPVHYRELSRDEWVRVQPQRACLTAVLVFEMSDERQSGRVPRPISHHSDGRVVFVERGFEDKVQLGVETRVSLIEPRNGGNVLFAIPSAVPTATPVRGNETERLDPPVQPADQLKVTVRSFIRKPDVAIVRSAADVKALDRQLSIYEILSDSARGIMTTATSSAATVRANANQIIDALVGTLHKGSPRLQRENVLARIDGMDVAVKRALAALEANGQKADNAAEQTVVQAVTDDGNQPKRRNRRRGRRNGRARDDHAATGDAYVRGFQIKAVVTPAARRAPGTATIGDAVGNALAKGFESIPPVSLPMVAPVHEAPVAYEPESDVIVPVREDDSAKGTPPATEVDENAEAFSRMAKDLKVTVEVVKAAFVRSGMSFSDFSETDRNVRKHFVREVKANIVQTASKSA